MISRRKVASDFEHWWDEHPLLKKFYVPLVLTATFVVSFVDVIHGGRSR